MTEKTPNVVAAEAAPVEVAAPVKPALVVEKPAAPKPVKAADGFSDDERHRFWHIPPAGFKKPKFPSST